VYIKDTCEGQETGEVTSTTTTYCNYQTTTDTQPKGGNMITESKSPKSMFECQDMCDNIESCDAVRIDYRPDGTIKKCKYYSWPAGEAVKVKESVGTDTMKKAKCQQGTTSAP